MPTRDTPRQKEPGSRRLRVLQVIDHLAVGGAQSVVLGIARLSDPAQFEMHVANVSGMRDPEVAAQLESACAGVYAIGARAAWDARALVGLTRLIRRGRFDVVHAHLMVSTILGTTAGRLAGRPTVVTLHNVASDRRNYPRGRRLLDGLATRRLARELIAVSDAVKRTYVKQLGFREERILVIRNAPVAPLLMPPGFDRQRKRRELGIEDGLALTTVARLTAQKDHETLLKALPGVIARHPGLTVLVAGEGELRGRLEDLARSLGVAQSIRFLGIRPDAVEVTGASDALCNLTHEFEGLPIAVADAMSLSIPVVATRTAAVEEVLVDGHTGLLVEPGDVAGVSRALLMLLDDVEARERIGAAGRTAVAERLDSGRFIEEHQRLYLRLAELQRPGFQLS